MFFNYPISAVQDNNFVHESIYESICLIINNQNTGIPIPEWPDLLPQRHRENLKSRRSIRGLLVEFSGLASDLSTQQRNQIINVIDSQNNIAGLLDNSVAIVQIGQDIEPLINCLNKIFLEGFSLLTRTKSRDAHYKAIYDSLVVKTCPFCGYEPFEAPGQKREDEDHYLLKDKYATSAANMHNLVPMGGKCNKSYKLQKDIIFNNGLRRKALNPYGSVAVQIDLLNTDPITFAEDIPDWKISISPDTEETRTWCEVFSIESRLIETVLTPNYERVLSEISDYFRDFGLNGTSSDNDILDCLQKYERFKKDNPEQGLGFLKDKVASLLKTNFESKNIVITGLIKDALPRDFEAA